MLTGVVTKVMRPLQASIDLSALKHNLGVARRHAPQSRVLAVIKANGYGHGLLLVAKALEAAEGFALLNLEDAVALRDAGYKQTILMLEGFFGAEELPILAKYHLASVIHSPEQLEMLERADLPGKVDVFLKLNSGMNRLGFRPVDFSSALQRLQAAPWVGSITLMTHFSCADEASGISEQLNCFDTVTANLGVPRSLANSAALLRYAQTHGDWVRPGIMLYGASPYLDISAASLDLRPVMTLTSAIIGLQEIQTGDAVGYGATYRAERPMRVGIVACGYADGYPRHAPSGTPILLNGQRSCTLGRVSMDMLCVDLTDIPKAMLGSSVTLWGKGLPVEEVAAAAGTISYELLCALAPRVPVVEI